MNSRRDTRQAPTRRAPTTAFLWSSASVSHEQPADTNAPNRKRKVFRSLQNTPKATASPALHSGSTFVLPIGRLLYLSDVYFSRLPPVKSCFEADPRATYAAMAIPGSLRCRASTRLYFSPFHYPTALLSTSYVPSIATRATCPDEFIAVALHRKLSQSCFHWL